MERRLKNERNGRVVLKNEQQRTQKKTVSTSIIGQPPDFVRRCRRLVIPREPSCLCFFLRRSKPLVDFEGFFEGISVARESRVVVTWIIPWIAFHVSSGPVENPLPVQGP